MSLSEHMLKTALHHAYLVEGERGPAIEELTGLLASFGVKIKGNPDFRVSEYDVFLLGDAHELKQEQQRFAVTGDAKYFIVAFNSIILEAQNALLKTLEEPTAGTHIFFVTRTEEMLLPTVRSRMQTVKAGKGEKGKKNMGEEFLKADLAERMKIIQPMSKAQKDEKAEAREQARLFLDEIEMALYGRFPNADLGNSLEHIIRAKRHLAGRSPSLKLLLEHLAITVPMS